MSDVSSQPFVGRAGIDCMVLAYTIPVDLRIMSGIYLVVFMERRSTSPECFVSTPVITEWCEMVTKGCRSIEMCNDEEVPTPAIKIYDTRAEAMANMLLHEVIVVRKDYTWPGNSNPCLIWLIAYLVKQWMFWLICKKIHSFVVCEIPFFCIIYISLPALYLFIP